MSARRRRAPSTLTLFVTIMATDLALRLFGFARSVALVKKLVGRSAAITKVDVAEVERACDRLSIVVAFYPGRARCLEQSLALYLWLRRMGLAVDLRLGVQPYPFNAHAWVEYRGRAINEREEYIRQFVPVQDFAV